MCVFIEISLKKEMYELCGRCFLISGFIKTFKLYGRENYKRCMNTKCWDEMTSEKLLKKKTVSDAQCCTDAHLPLKDFLLSASGIL